MAPANPVAVAPNPDPSRYTIVERVVMTNGVQGVKRTVTIIRARYDGCTNFEGNKIMVFKGDFDPTGSPLDPHFRTMDRNSPIARFSPDYEGQLNSVLFARMYLGLQR